MKEDQPPTPIPELIHGRLDDLTKAERRVAQTILGDYPLLALRSTAVIAEESGTSPATVTRFSNKLGFDGLGSLQDAVREGLDLSRQSPFALYEPPEEGTALTSAGKAVASLVTEGTNRIEPDTLDQAVEFIVGARQVWVWGGRFSFGIAHILYAHLNLLRRRVRLLSGWPTPVPDQIQTLGRDELAIVFDFRRYDPMAEFVASSFQTNRSKTIVVTDPYLSPAAAHAAITFITPIEGHGLVDSYASAAALVDVLVATLIAADEGKMARRAATTEHSRHAAEEIVGRRAGQSDHVWP